MHQLLNIPVNGKSAIAWANILCVICIDVSVAMKASAANLKIFIYQEIQYAQVKLEKSFAFCFNAFIDHRLSNESVSERK